MGQIVTGNTDRLLQSYVDDFPIGHAAGIIGEIGYQNPIDATAGPSTILTLFRSHPRKDECTKNQR